MNNVPDVSVMMCAYNAEQYIGEAIDSILKQTYTDFELIIVDDGSTDGTLNIARSYKNERIRLLRGCHDYIHSLNLGMRACRGKFIARMDADDRMKPQRLERQLAIMHNQPNLAACFSWSEAFGASEKVMGYHAKGHVQNALFWLLTGNYLMHPTVMLRHSFMQEHGIRYKRYAYAEDYKMWFDMLTHGAEIYVMPEALLEYRVGHQQVSHLHNAEQNVTRLIVQQEILESLLGSIQHPMKTHLRQLYKHALHLNQSELLQGDEIVVMMYRLLQRTGVYEQNKN